MDEIRRAERVYSEMMGASSLELFLEERPRSVLVNLRLHFARFLLFLLMPTYVFSQTVFCLIHASTIPIPSLFLRLSLIINSFLGSSKALIFLHRLPEMRKLMTRFDHFSSIRRNPEIAARILGEKASSLRRRAKVVNTLVLLLFILWVSRPFFNSKLVKSLVGLRSEGGNRTEVEIILPSFYPFTTSHSPVYEVILLYEFLVSVGGLSYLLPMDLFFTSLAEMYASQVDVLKESLDRLHRDRLHEFVAEHIRLLKVSEEMGKVLSPVLAAQMLGSVISICGSTLSMALESGVSDGGMLTLFMKMKYYFFFIVMLTQLLIYCVTCDVIITANDSITLAVYDTEWYEKDNSFRKAIQLILLRSQQPTVLTAMGLLKIDLATFLDVLRLSYSYYTFLRKMGGDSV